MEIEKFSPTALSLALGALLGFLLNRIINAIRHEAEWALL